MELTDSCQRRGGGGTGGKRVKGLAKEHICIIRGHRQQCGDSQREVGQGLRGGGQSGGWDICNNINNKNKDKHKEKTAQTTVN